MRVRHLTVVACLALASCKQGARSDGPALPPRSDKLVRAAAPVPGSYLVAMASGLGQADAAALAARHGATVRAWLPAPVNAALVTLDPSKAIALAEDPAVRIAEEDQVMRVASVEWNLDRIDQRATVGDGIYAHATSGKGVDVYVLDTGVMAAHAELAGRASQVADFVHRAPAAIDCNGTHVAGIVAG